MIRLQYSIADRRCYQFTYGKKKFRVWVVDEAISMENDKGVILEEKRHKDKFDVFRKELARRC